MTNKQLKKPRKKTEIKIPYIIKTEDGNIYLIADKVVSVKKYNAYILKHNLFKKEEIKEEDDIKNIYTNEITLKENITVSF